MLDTSTYQQSSGRGSGSSSQYPMLEEQLVLLFVEAIEQSDKALKISNSDEDPAVASFIRERTQIFWFSLCSELIFFLLYQFVNFSNFIDSICKILKSRQTHAHSESQESSLPVDGCSGRDELMWALLQYISGSIAKNTVTDFLPVLKLFFLYDEPTPLPVPDMTSKHCARPLAAAAIYIHLSRKMATQNGDNSKDLMSNQFQYSLPIGKSSLQFKIWPLDGNHPKSLLILFIF